MVRLGFFMFMLAACILILRGRGGLSPRARPTCVEKVPAISKLPPYFQTEEQFRFSHVDSDVDLYGANFKS